MDAGDFMDKCYDTIIFVAIIFIFVVLLYLLWRDRTITIEVRPTQPLSIQQHTDKGRTKYTITT